MLDPSKTTDSILRINLYGKARLLPPPKISPAIYVEPWGMGSNPKWNNR